MDDRVPPPGEVLEQQREEIEAAETAEETYEAIDPVLAVCAMYDQLPEYDDLPPGADIPEKLSRRAPLSIDEIHARLEGKKYEIQHMDEDPDPAPESPQNVETILHERSGRIGVSVDEITYDDGDVVRAVQVYQYTESGEWELLFDWPEESARKLYELLGEAFPED